MPVSQTGTPSDQQPSKSFPDSGRDLIFYGDPHGVWEPLLSACAAAPPDGVVLLGDCELTKPLRKQIAPVFAAGISVFWIPGNHDVHSAIVYDRLWGDHPCGNLHTRNAYCGGLSLAGLGGVFRGQIWYPTDPDAVPVHRSRSEYLAQTRRTDHWRGGLPLRQRDTIFPEDLDTLACLRADVLVVHEAPSCHRHGFAAVDRAAQACGARLIIHGHHHHSYLGITEDGLHVRGLGKAEVFRLRSEDVP